jgi:hypothetical protein
MKKFKFQTSRTFSVVCIVGPLPQKLSHRLGKEVNLSTCKFSEEGAESGTKWLSWEAAKR